MNKRGFALVETVSAIAILCLVMIMLFELIVLFKGMYDKGESSVEIQENAHVAQVFMESRLYLCSEVLNVKNIQGGIELWDDFEEGELESIKFKLDKKIVQISINIWTKKLFCKTNFSVGGRGYEFADYVNSMSAQRIEDGKGIRVVLEFGRGNCSQKTDFTVYFRNRKI